MTLGVATFYKDPWKILVRFSVCPIITIKNVKQEKSWATLSPQGLFRVTLWEQCAYFTFSLFQCCWFAVNNLIWTASKIRDLDLQGLQLRMGMIRNLTIPPNGFGSLTVPLMIVYTFEEEICWQKKANLIDWLIDWFINSFIFINDYWLQQNS